MNEDLRELLASLKSHRVEFLVIGAHAVAFYGRPRMTEDLDLFVGASRENAERLRKALEEFGAPIGLEGAERFASANRQMVRLGTPPNMVDILNFAGSRSFDEVYARRLEGELEGITLHFPAKEDLIEMKRAAGRRRDLADIESLGAEPELGSE
jgi:predicted nucleotidyltransferase